MFKNEWGVIGVVNSTKTYLYCLDLLYISYPMQAKCILVGYHVACLPRLSLLCAIPPNAHPSAHTTLNPAPGISQWAYLSWEVCADENRKKERYGGEREGQMWGERDGGGEDVEPWSWWWMREKMLVDGYSPLWVPCECDSSRKNVHMGWLVWRDIGNHEWEVEGEGRGVCEHEGCVDSGTCFSINKPSFG